MKKINMNGSCTVHNKTTKLAVLFAIVGAMIVVVPMLIGQVNAYTEGFARSFSSDRPGFTNIKWHLDAGKWIHTPALNGGHKIIWATRGTGFFGGGDEKGSVEADIGRGHVKFFWFNPARGLNTCNEQSTGPVHVSCSIGQGPLAVARYSVTLR